MLYNNMTLDELINEIQYSDDPLLKAIYSKLTGNKSNIKTKLKESINEIEAAQNNMYDSLRLIEEALDEL